MRKHKLKVKQRLEDEESSSSLFEFNSNSNNCCYCSLRSLVFLVLLIGVISLTALYKSSLTYGPSAAGSVVVYVDRIYVKDAKLTVDGVGELKNISPSFPFAPSPSHQLSPSHPISPSLSHPLSPHLTRSY